MIKQWLWWGFKMWVRNWWLFIDSKFRNYAFLSHYFYSWFIRFQFLDFFKTLKVPSEWRSISSCKCKKKDYTHYNCFVYFANLRTKPFLFISKYISKLCNYAILTAKNFAKPLSSVPPKVQNVNKPICTKKVEQWTNCERNAEKTIKKQMAAR